MAHRAAATGYGGAGAGLWPAMIIESTRAVASNITGAIRDAAAATGASFDYLLKTAVRESNLDPAAKSASSSATGLFQFIDQTWLETLKWAGPQLGYAQFANDIVQTPSGQLTVPDAERRREIMALRKDPAASAAMAAAFTQRNAAILTDRLGRPPSQGELYIAHFIGAGGAAQLISAAAATPNAKAADLFPEAAQANRAIFFERSGGGRSVAQVYEVLVSRHDCAPSTAPQPRAVAALPPATSASEDAPTRSPLHLPPLPGEAPAGPSRARAEGGPVFHSLFQSQGRGPVSSFVSGLWGTPNVQASASGGAPNGARPLELFRTAGADAAGARGGN